MQGLWWQTPALVNELQHSLDLVNDGRLAGKGRELHACRDYFGALDYLSATLARVENAGLTTDPIQRSAATRIADLLKRQEPAQQERFLGMPSVQALATFEPPILNHRVAGMTQFLTDITDPVRREASREHREFKTEWTSWRNSGSGRAKTVSKLCRAVMVVRNSLAHGEKTRAGPDMERVRRNRGVALVVRGVLEDFLDCILDWPSRRLCAYGTLQPGQPNHGVIAVNDGQWSSVTLLNGEVQDDGGLPFFTPAAGKTGKAELFTSEELPDLWRSLDEFEGSAYQRVLGLYQLGGLIGVGNVYSRPPAEEQWF